MSKGKTIITPCEYCGALVARYFSQRKSQSFCNPKCLGQWRSFTLAPVRFWAHVEKTETCWLWKGSTFSNHYGRVQFHGQTSLAHRVAWGLTYGAIPDGLFVCHHCDHPPCVKPAYLFLGTCAENIADMQAKHRRVWAKGSETAGAKIQESDVILICALRDSMTVQALAEQFHISPRNIHAIQTGGAWKHVERPSATVRKYTKVTPTQVQEMRHLKNQKSLKEIAMQFHITVRHASDILKEVYWKGLQKGQD